MIEPSYAFCRTFERAALTRTRGRSENAKQLLGTSNGVLHRERSIPEAIVFEIVCTKLTIDCVMVAIEREVVWIVRTIASIQCAATLIVRKRVAIARTQLFCTRKRVVVACMKVMIETIKHSIACTMAPIASITRFMHSDQTIARSDRMIGRRNWATTRSDRSAMSPDRITAHGNGSISCSDHGVLSSDPWVVLPTLLNAERITAPTIDAREPFDVGLGAEAARGRYRCPKNAP